jgi:hypothetical protein
VLGGGGKSCQFIDKILGNFFFPSVSLSIFSKFVGKKFANFLNKSLESRKKEKKRKT